MQLTDDGALLRQYAENHSDEAFAGLVARHINLVYSVALRHVGDPHHAEEVTQAVFIILAKKAAQLRHNKALSSWLFQTTRLTAANFVRSESRRNHREQEAYMQSTLNESGEDVWPVIAPLLDTAVEGLSEKDRRAIVLRYYEGRNLSEVGTALGASESAAEKRVTRAVERLRRFFTKRGVTLTAAAIAGAVSVNSVQAAPLGLAATVTATAAKGTLISATLTTLVKGTMKTMTWLKIKFATGFGTAALIAGGAATVAISQTGGDKLSREEIFQKSQAAYAALSSYSDDGKSVAVLNGTTITDTFSIKLGRPNFYRIEWQQSSESAAYKSTSEKQLIWSEGKGDYLEMLGKVRKEPNMESIFSSAAGISGRASATIPGTFFSLNSANELGGSTASAKQQADAKVGDVDCYVFTSESQGRTKTMWIGKQDFLIRQVRIVTSAETMKAIMAEAAKRNPEIVARMSKIEYTDNIATETHENIVVNRKFSPTDFAR